MSPYVISKTNDKSVLDTIVFHAGEDGDEEAVAVFTNEAAAQNYVDQANWDEPHRPVALAPLALLQWLYQSYNQGVQNLTVDPQRQPQIAGHPQPVLSIESALARCANELVAVIQAGGD